MAECYMVNISKDSFIENIKQSLPTALREGIIEDSAFKYDKETSQWKEFTKETSDIIDKTDLSLITYNVWFSFHNRENRISAVSEILQKYEPDFICIQEATQEFISSILNQTFFQEKYYINKVTLSMYDVVILSKYYAKFHHVLFNTSQSRNLQIAGVKIKQELGLVDLLVSSAHLESMIGNDFKRISQLKKSFQVLNNSKLAFFMGDFNFDPSDPEEKYLDEGWKDSWKLWGEIKNLPESEGVTRPPEKNKDVRYDRVMFKDELNILELTSFEIIGNEPIKVKETDISYSINTPSDHYGIYSKYTLKNVV